MPEPTTFTARFPDNGWFPRPMTLVFGLGTRLRVRMRTRFVPRLSWNANMYRAESLVSLLRKHDVIKTGPEQKGSVLHVVQPTMLQRSVCMLFNAR